MSTKCLEKKLKVKRKITSWMCILKGKFFISITSLQIPQHDYTSAISTIIEAPKMRWYTLWYNRLFSSTICAVITALIIVGVVGNLSTFHNKGKGKLHVGVSLLIAIVLSAVVVGLLHLIVFYEKRKVRTKIPCRVTVCSWKKKIMRSAFVMLQKLGHVTKEL